ncbi:TRAP transporter small permease subunit [Nitratireductor aquimarinus]|uniref:TRAP transporter small permease subunit n=1 Tax=Nitratireductor aquimarinus TaxID=889300 RepID=UPI002936B6F4|nr:TRAP transporter small permease subunit [Nitratireductor aquimarinus]MDV2965717.1 TRAP transporter small permease subunit [Nitratireductor aquimarinus]
MHLYLRFCAGLDRLATAFCVLACLALTASVLAIVVMRYGFGIGFIELQDFASYAFAVLLIFSVPVCMRRGGHVRVEVLSENLSPAYARIADAVAVFLFLVPVFGLIIWADWADLAYSWSIREASVETGGLPGLFIVKTALPLGAAMMILQGIAMVLEPRADHTADGEPSL